MVGAPQELSFQLPDLATGELRHIVAYQWGDASAERTVLCVHGLTRNGRDFDYLARALAAKGRRVICPDMPGRGKSRWLAQPAGYNNAAYVADITQMLASLGISRVEWVGTSMGGILAIMAAAAAPALISKLVLNDIGAVIHAAGLERIFSYAGNKLVFATRQEAQEAMRTIFAPFGIRDEEHWQHMFTHSLRQAEDGSFTLAYDPSIIASLPRPEGAVQDIVLWPFMAGIMATPTLLIRGAQSDLLTREAALEMKAKMPLLSLYEVPHAGHAPSLMEAQDVQAVADFLG